MTYDMSLDEAVVPYVMKCCPDNKSAIFGDEIKDNYNTEIGNYLMWKKISNGAKIHL